MPESPRILLLSAYRADSHAAWSDWLAGVCTGCDWQRLELPGRHFGWRIRGNPLSWLDALPGHPPDAILATSMVDLATLRGLQPRLVRVPAALYFHENQFAYPASDRQVASLEARMVQLYGALAADRLLFNSAWNRDSFLAGVDSLLARMPDAVPQGIPARLAAKADLLPVPVRAVSAGAIRDPGLIVWNHRWEYDKAPERFASAILELAGQGADFRLALLGSRPDPEPEPLRLLRQRLPECIVADGRLDETAYHEVLGRAGIVVSTADHEFQGLSVLEAVSAGALPLVPDALCYPEQFAPAYRYRPGDVAALVARLEDWLAGERPDIPDVSAWTGGGLATAWKGMLEDLTATSSRSPREVP